MNNRDIQPKRRIVTLPFSDVGILGNVPIAKFTFEANSVLHHVSSTVEISILNVGLAAIVAGGVNLQRPPLNLTFYSYPYGTIEDAIHYYSFEDQPLAVLPLIQTFSDRTDMNSMFVKAGSVFNVWVPTNTVDIRVRGAFILHISTTSEWVNFEEKVKRF